jgi:hypothetical protein
MTAFEIDAEIGELALLSAVMVLARRRGMPWTPPLESLCGRPSLFCIAEADGLRLSR